MKILKIWSINIKWSQTQKLIILDIPCIKVINIIVNWYVTLL